jgi:hypothetical protein
MLEEEYLFVTRVIIGKNKKVLKTKERSTKWPGKVTVNKAARVRRRVTSATMGQMGSIGLLAMGARVSKALSNVKRDVGSHLS